MLNIALGEFMILHFGINARLIINGRKKRYLMMP